MPIAAQLPMMHANSAGEIVLHLIPQVVADSACRCGGAASLPYFYHPIAGV
jgi:hypothetical protein